jgi:Esterase/lipase
MVNKRIQEKAISLCLVSNLISAETNAPEDYHHSEVSSLKQHSVYSYQHLTIDNNTTDILNHAAFQGYASLILPWDALSQNKDVPLRNIQSLLPYHSHISPDIVVGALNRMIDEINKRETIFYSFYSEQQKKRMPEKNNTGLFFFRGKKGAPFAIVCPGGGFEYVGLVHEGFPYAEAISREGYNVFVLRYRVGHGGVNAIQDLASAITYIFRNANKLQVGTQGYSLWGSSAGARLAAAVGSYGVARFGGDNLPKPAAVIMAYTGYSDYTVHEPPTFVAVGSRDRIAPPGVIKQRVKALKNQGTVVEYHQYPNVGHGFGLGKGTSAEGWVLQAIQFWEKGSNFLSIV